MIASQLKELLLQSLDHERGGVLVYQTALECAVNDDLREEWEEYLEQTQNHVAVLTRTCEALGLDPGEMTPGCQIVQHTGKSLVVAMKMALAAGDPQAPSWWPANAWCWPKRRITRIGSSSASAPRPRTAEAAPALKAAYDEVEDQEDEHLYHTKGWCRELWLQSLGLPAVLPPPEEKQHVTNAVEAAAAKENRRS